MNTDDLNSVQIEEINNFRKFIRTHRVHFLEQQELAGVVGALFQFSTAIAARGHLLESTCGFTWEFIESIVSEEMQKIAKEVV